MAPRILGSWPDGSQEWLEARRNRIGGSEIGTVMGLNTFETREQLLLRKRGELEPRKQTDAMMRGHFCEQAIADWLAWKEDIEYRHSGAEFTYVDSERDWMAYNPDQMTTDDRLCEFKTANERSEESGWGRAGTDQVPPSYKAQVNWGMGILLMKKCLVAVLAGGTKSGPNLHFQRYFVEFDPDMFLEQIEYGEKFIADVKNPDWKPAVAEETKEIRYVPVAN